MSDYYDHTTFPQTGTVGSSAQMRAELELIEAGFNKLPDLVGNALKLVRINASATAQEAVLNTTVQAADIVAATAKATPVSADMIPIVDSAAGNTFKKVTWADLLSAAGAASLSRSNNLSDLTSAASARNNLGLGTLATQNGTFSGTSSGTNTGDQNTFQTIVVAGQSNVVADATNDTLTLIAGGNVVITTDPSTDSITISSTGLADGDKGDITVSGSGSAWTIDNDAVTYAKMQNVSAADRILGRSTAGAGDIEEIVCTAAGRALLDDANAAAQRATLGLGSLATLNSVGHTEIDATTVTPGAYTYASITVGADGRITAASSGASPSAFPAGTRMSFNQTAAPTGWTKDTTAALNDSIMRIVTGTVGSGGSTAFSTFNGQTSVGATTLSTTQMPSHAHSVVGRVSGTTNPATHNIVGQFSGSDITASVGTGAQGGGGSHTHSITTEIKYNDFIIASKD